MTEHTTKPAAADHCRPGRWQAWGWWLFAALALFFLLSEHPAHLFGVLPLLLLLACPLMHLVMHRGHGRHRDRPGEVRPPEAPGRADER